MITLIQRREGKWGVATLHLLSRRGAMIIMAALLFFSHRAVEGALQPSRMQSSCRKRGEHGHGHAQPLLTQKRAWGLVTSPHLFLFGGGWGDDGLGHAHPLDRRRRVGGHGHIPTFGFSSCVMIAEATFFYFARRRRIMVGTMVIFHPASRSCMSKMCNSHQAEAPGHRLNRASSIQYIVHYL